MDRPTPLPWGRPRHELLLLVLVAVMGAAIAWLDDRLERRLSPVAPGTAGTVVAIPLGYFLTVTLAAGPALQVAAIVAVYLVLALAFAQTPQPTTADPVANKRAVALSEELRCLVCQNQSIAESNAELAVDHSGMFPCLRGRRLARLLRRVRSARTMSTRVSWGRITSST